MFLSDLVPFAVAAVNGPGGSFFDDTDDEMWELVIANAFWDVHLRGFFKDWRVDVNNIEIVNVVDPDEVFDRGAAQIIVKMAVLSALESRAVGLATKEKAKAGPVESETQFDARLMLEKMKSLREEIKDLLEDLNRSDASMASFADMVVTRFSAGGPVWLD